MSLLTRETAKVLRVELILTIFFFFYKMDLFDRIFIVGIII